MRLFKYLHPDRIDVLRGRKIRFSHALALNDPFELKPNITGIADEDHIEKTLDEIWPDILTEELNKIPAELRKLIPEDTLRDLAVLAAPSIRKNIQAMTAAIGPPIRKSMESSFDRLLGTLCLSEHDKSLPMWAHYADSHRGFLIEFDSDSPFFNQRKSPDDDLRHLRRVTYSEKRPSPLKH